MASIPKKVADRLTKQVGPFQRVLRNAKDRDVNESDTVTIVVDMLAAVFGYDKFLEVTSEQLIKGTYCDLAVKIDGKIKFLIEVKAIGLTLKENHLHQAISYGANEGIDWVVLTNGTCWEIYKLRFEKPIACDLVCRFDFLELNARKQDDQSQLFLLCKEGISKAAIEDFHDQVQIVNRFIIGATLLTEPVLNAIRRELRGLFDGVKGTKVKVTKEDIGEILVADVLKRDIVEGDAAKQAKSRVARAANKKAKKKAKKAGNSNPAVPKPQPESGDG